MSFEIVSEEGFPDSEIWTCDHCGYSVCLVGTGGDVAECPECIRREYNEEAQAEQQREYEELQRSNNV